MPDVSRRVRGWVAWVDRIVPHFLHQGDPIARRRARMLVFGTLMFVAYGVFHAAVELSIEPLPRALVGLAIVTVGCTFGFAALRRLHRRFDLDSTATWCLVLIFSVVVIYVYMKGGLAAPGLPWFPVLPVVARALVGSRGVTWSAVGTLLVALGFAASDAWNLPAPPPPSGGALEVKRVMAVSAATILCAGLVYMNGVFEEEAQRALVRTRDAATSANRAKSLFVANVSHEIRTPMTAILGYTDVLAEPDLSESERREAIETLRRNGHQLLALINDMLDLSKIEAGGLELRRVDASPIGVAQQVTALLRDRARAKGLSLELELAPDLPDAIFTDPVRLQQILVNLVGNAIKFTEQGGVRIAVARDGEGASGWLRFDVIDTGIGVELADRERIFEPFSQGDASASRRYGGTGLGLAISRSLAAGLGGSLELASEPGGGSTFSLLVPLERPSAAECLPFAPPTNATALPSPMSGSAEPLPTLRGRVLLAEDGADNQRLIARLLSRAGLEVEIAADGRRAVDAALASLAAGQPFDLVLMDMQMPELDGFAATAALRDGGFVRPIIALSAHAMREDRERCLEAGCDAFASKPIDRRELLSLLAQHLAKPGSFSA